MELHLLSFLMSPEWLGLVFLLGVVYGPTNTFATQNGNVPVSQLDQNFTDAFLGINNAYLVGTHGARPAPDGIGKGRYYFETDTQTLFRDNGSSWVQVAATASLTVPRSYLAGCTMSTAGGSATMSTSAGQATDNTNVNLMNLTATSKTTAAWVVGAGNGGLDTGVIANSTWYHFFVITRTDTNVVDQLFSLSATAPTMPANYTLKRYMGSGLIDGAGHWTAFSQDGDDFLWLASVKDLDTTNPGAAAVTATLASVPLGVVTYWHGNVEVTVGATTNAAVYVSSLVQNDEAPSQLNATPNTDMTTVAAGATYGAVRHRAIRMNTSQQLRYRLTASDANTRITFATLGYTNRRGRDA